MAADQWQGSPSFTDRHPCRNADGTSNLDPITKGGWGKSTLRRKPEPSGQPSPEHYKWI